jgi:WD40 repeat protein
LAFSPDSSKLCAASDKGTVHIFKLESKDLTPLSDDDIPEEQKSTTYNKYTFIGTINLY